MTHLNGSRVYRNAGYAKVQGWFWPEDYDLFARTLAKQLDADIEGDVLEIGCYHGKSAILMGYGLREAEQLIICDLFGAPEETAEVTDHFEDSFNQDTFVDNYYRFHPQRPPVIHAMSSFNLPEKLAAEQRRLRFTHVDGGHAEEVAAFDIQTAAIASHPMGVIAIDDYRTHHTPGVGAAIWAAAYRGEIYPFALSENKVYAAATPDVQGYWLKTFCEFGLPGGELHNIFGREVLRLTGGKLCG